MTDWIEHNGGPQPVADDVWVQRRDYQNRFGIARAFRWDAPQTVRYRILNQHLIDAALKRGIELGLEAANKAIEALYADDVTDRQMALEDASMAVCALNPDTIARDVQTSSHQAKCDDLHTAREAVLDQLTREAQAQGMGYDKEAD